MISEEKFYEIVMTNFRDLTTKIDNIKENVSALCERTSLVEQDVENIVKQKIAASETKHKILTGIFGLITSVATIITIWPKIFP